MKLNVNRSIVNSVGFAACLHLALALPARNADAGSKSFTATNMTWQSECGSCHVAYPPQLLTQESWRKIMSGLDKHFGTDASLDPATAAEIGTFLARNAAQGKRAARAGSVLRITETAWFRKEHDEVSAATWKNPKVKSAVNCNACHAGAERGDYSERTLRVPR